MPKLSPKSIVQKIKSITAREIFKQNSETKRMLWGGRFWTSGYYINTVGLYAGAEIIKNYKKIHTAQLTLFERVL